MLQSFSFQMFYFTEMHQKKSHQSWWDISSSGFLREKKKLRLYLIYRWYVKFRTLSALPTLLQLLI